MSSIMTIGGWTTHRAPDGREYWYHTTTKQSTYDKPEVLKSEREKALGVTPWREHTNQGRKYYFNTATKESRWDVPAEYKDWLDKVIKVRDEEARAAFKTGPAVPSASSSASGPSMAAAHEFHSRMEAELAFRELLAAREVGPEWTWEQTMIELVTDPVYRGLRSWIDKRAVFEHWVGEVKEKKEEERRKRIERHVTSLREMMKRHPQTKSYMSYYTATQVYHGNAVWQAIKDEAERVVAFDQIVTELRQADNEQGMKRRKQAMDEFGGLLAGQVDILTSWREALDKVRAMPEFQQDALFRDADLVDLLMVFEETVKQMEREEIEKRETEREERRRQARKSREAYVALLTEFKLAGVLTGLTTWEEVVPLLNEEERFHKMMGQPGSTALELFLDMREELKEALEKEAEVLLDALQARGRNVEAKTTLETFEAWLAETTCEMTSEDVYTLIHTRLEAKSSNESREEERRRRHRMEDFRYRLKKLVGDLEIDLDLDLESESLHRLPYDNAGQDWSEVDKVILRLWKETEPKISATEEYQVLAPPERLTSFIKFCRRQQDKSRERLRELKKRERERHRSRRLSEERRGGVLRYD